MHWEELSWIQQATWVEDIPDALLQVQILWGENQPHKFLFLEANPMFACQRTAGIHAGTQNVTTSGKHSLDFILVTLIKKDDRV